MKMRYRPDRKQIFYCVITGVALVILLHPCRHAASYEYLSTDDIIDNLYVKLAANLNRTALVGCSYEDVIRDNTAASIRTADGAGSLIEDHGIKEGGEYAPKDCVPSFSTAIIVAYPYRPEQLEFFLIYMHTLFRHQKIHYRIFVIEQTGVRGFNRAKLLNIGAVAAMKAGYPCLVLHDIDLLPLSPANIYACTKQPRHMSANINIYRYVLPYSEFIGGVISITSQQYKTVNGMPNGFFGSDDKNANLYKRLKEHNLQVCRFDPVKNTYIKPMFDYDRPYDSTPETAPANEDRRKPPPYVAVSSDKDGLNTLRYTVLETLLHPLFTQITVDLDL